LFVWTEQKKKEVDNLGKKMPFNIWGGGKGYSRKGDLQKGSSKEGERTRVQISLVG